MAANTFGPEYDAYGAELMRRIADTVAIMLYEMELRPDGSYECLAFIGLETLIGPVPDGMSAEEAYDARVHADDREVYDGAVERLWQGEPLEVEYRLIGRDGEELWVLDRMRPELPGRRRLSTHERRRRRHQRAQARRGRNAREARTRGAA